MPSYKELEIETQNTTMIGRQYDASSQSERVKKMRETHPSLEKYAYRWLPNRGKIEVKVKRRHPYYLNFPEGEIVQVSPMDLREIRIVSKKPLSNFLYEKE